MSALARASGSRLLLFRYRRAGVASSPASDRPPLFGQHADWPRQAPPGGGRGAGRGMWLSASTSIKNFAIASSVGESKATSAERRFERMLQAVPQFHGHQRNHPEIRQTGAGRARVFESGTTAACSCSAASSTSRRSPGAPPPRRQLAGRAHVRCASVRPARRAGDARTSRDRCGRASPPSRREPRGAGRQRTSASVPSAEVNAETPISAHHALTLGVACRLLPHAPS